MPGTSKGAKRNAQTKAGSKAKSKSNAKAEHAPTLTTILMVEDALKNMPDSIMKISELKRALPRKVNHNTLMRIIDYLDECNRICIGRKGICWLVNDSPKLRNAIEDARKHGRIF